MLYAFVEQRGEKTDPAREGDPEPQPHWGKKEDTHRAENAELAKMRQLAHKNAFIDHKSEMTEQELQTCDDRFYKTQNKLTLYTGNIS